MLTPIILCDQHRLFIADNLIWDCFEEWIFGFQKSLIHPVLSVRIRYDLLAWHWVSQSPNQVKTSQFTLAKYSWNHWTAAELKSIAFGNLRWVQRVKRISFIIGLRSVKATEARFFRISKELWKYAINKFRLDTSFNRAKKDIYKFLQRWSIPKRQRRCRPRFFSQKSIFGW